jgi:hypothetical protein
MISVNGMEAAGGLSLSLKPEAGSGGIEVLRSERQRVALPEEGSGGPGAGGALPTHVRPDVVLILEDVEGAY